MGPRVDTAPGPENFQTLKVSAILRHFLCLCRECHSARLGLCQSKQTPTQARPTVETGLGWRAGRKLSKKTHSDSGAFILVSPALG